MTNFMSTTYSIMDIGLLKGDTMSDATDVNALEKNVEGQELQVVAYSTADDKAGLGVFPDGGKRQAFLRGKQPHYLLDLDAQDNIHPFSFGQALGINNIFPSQVVGWGNNDSTSIPVLWEGPTPRTTPLNTLGGRAGQARSVNDFGHIVGWAHTDKGKRHAFLCG